MNRGFTLIELLVVVLVIGILAAVALPQYQTAVERSRATEALTLMSAVRSAMERYHAQYERWPTAHNFNQLDVDVPVFAACANTNDSVGHGGKNFCLDFAGNTITATRRRENGAYSLATVISANANGTYTAKRSCGCPAPSSDCEGDALAYCNAISGGHTGTSTSDPGF